MLGPEECWAGLGASEGADEVASSVPLPLGPHHLASKQEGHFGHGLEWGRLGGAAWGPWAEGDVSEGWRGHLQASLGGQLEVVAAAEPSAAAVCSCSPQSARRDPSAASGSEHRTQHSQQVEFKSLSLSTLKEDVAAYLLQLFLHRPLLLSDAAELGGVLLTKDSSGLLGCSLFG